MYLKLNKGGGAEPAPTISQKDMQAVAAGGQIFQKLGGRYYELRVKKEARTDGKEPEWEIDQWVPVEGDVPSAVSSAADSAEKEAHEVQRRPDTNLQRSAEQDNPKNVPPQQRQNMDPNYRNSLAAKERADRIGAGNLALRDPMGQPHDGQPAPNDKGQPNQSAPGRPAAGTVVERERLENPGTASNTSKPAAPTPPGAGSPSGRPPVPGPTRTPKEGEK